MTEVAEAGASEVAIEARALTKRFGAFTAVDAVSFRVRHGEILGFLGANGAGKSTTVKMLCGLLRPTLGTAIVAGVDVSRHPERVRRVIGYMSQRFSLYPDLSATENLDFFGGAQGLGGKGLRARIEAVLERTGLSAEHATLARDLPQGFRQRLALACAILHEPEILFLDEPTAGVDPAARQNFFGLVRELSASGTTVFVTTHHMEEAEYCDRVGLMAAGRLVAMDVPKRLKETYVPGRLFSVEGLEPTQTGALLTLPGVVSAERFGARMHVRLSDLTTDREAFERLLTAHGLRPAVLEEIEPTLEDVFFAVVAQEGAR